MAKYFVSVQPFVSESAHIEVPDDVKDVAAYIDKHFDNIDFSEDYHDYSGAPMVVRDSNDNIVFEEE